MRIPFANELSARLPASSRSVVGLTGRRLVTAALCLVGVGCCGGTTPSASPSQAAPTPAPSPAQATDTQGRYQLVFELPRTDWQTTDSITGLATLSLIGSGGVDFGSSGSGPIGFGFDEVGGNRHVGPVWTANCMYGRLESG